MSTATIAVNPIPSRPRGMLALPAVVIVAFFLLAPLALILRFATRRGMMAAGGFIASLGLLGIALWPDWRVDVLFYSVTGFGFFMLHNSVQAEVSELAPAARSTAYSLHAFSFFLGQAIAPIAFGPMHNAIGAGLTLQIDAAILTIGAVTASRLLRRDLVSGILR